MKLKWWFPFSPLAWGVLTDPYIVRPVPVRWIMVTANLIMTACLLADIQPWKADEQGNRS